MNDTLYVATVNGVQVTMAGALAAFCIATRFALEAAATLDYATAAECSAAGEEYLHAFGRIVEDRKADRASGAR